MRTQLVNGLFADLLQVVRFLRVYLKRYKQNSMFRVTPLRQEVRSNKFLVRLYMYVCILYGIVYNKRSYCFECLKTKCLYNVLHNVYDDKHSRDISKLISCGERM